MRGRVVGEPVSPGCGHVGLYRLLHIRGETRTLKGAGVPARTEVDIAGYNVRFDRFRPPNGLETADERKSNGSEREACRLPIHSRTVVERKHRTRSEIGLARRGYF